MKQTPEPVLPCPKFDSDDEVLSEHEVRIGGRRIQCWTTIHGEYIEFEGNHWPGTYDEALKHASQIAMTEGNKWR